MTAAKRGAYVATLVLASVMLVSTAVYLLLDDETLVAWIVKGTGSATGVDIKYSEPIKLTRTLSPTLRVSDLSIADLETGYSVHTSSLEMQISLARLFLGKLVLPRLWLGDTRVELSEPAITDKKAHAPSADEQRDLPPMPALQDVRIAQLRIVSGQQEMLVPTLDVEELALGFEHDTDTLQLTAQIDMADESVAVQVNVPQFEDSLNAQTFNFSVSARSAAASLLVNGQLDIAKPEFTIDGKLVAQASDLKQLPTGIQGLKAPGTLAARAQLAGTIDRLAISDLRLQWQGPQQSSLEIRGRIDDLDDLNGIAMDVSGELGESPWLAAILPDTVGILKHARLSAHVSGAGKQLQIRELSLRAKDSNELDVSLDGQLDLNLTEGHAEEENLELELSFNAPTTRAARVLLFDDVPEFGAIEGRTDIRSETGPPSFENIVISARDAAGIEVDLNGRIAYFPLNPDKPNRGYDLDVTIKASQSSLMAERLGLNLTLAGPAATTFRIEGDTKALRLERIKATAGKKQSLRLSAEGKIHFRDWDLQDPLHSINLDLLLNSHTTLALARLLDTELPELGALSAKAHLHTVSNRHQITDFQLQTAKRAPVSVSLSGTVDQVVFLPELNVEDIALGVSASTADLNRLNALFGWQNTIPDIGAAKVRAKLSGNDSRLSISDVSITAGKPDVLLIEARGHLGTLAASKDWQPQNTDLSVQASATGSKAFAKLLGYHVPELGPITASAKMRDKKGKFKLESGQLVIGNTRTPMIEADGFFDDLFGAGRTRWNVDVDLDGHRLAAFTETPRLSDLGALRGALQISNLDGSLGIDSLSLNNIGSTQLKVAVSGHYGDFNTPESLSLSGQLEALDMQTVGALFDVDLPTVGPVRIDTRISRSGEHTAFDTRMVADKFALDAELVAALDAEPPRLSGKLRARNAFNPYTAERAIQDVKQKRESKGPVFSQEPITFDWLNKVDLDLSLNIESFDPKRARAKSVQAQITQKSGTLAVSPSIIEYPSGELELDLRIEARDRPRIYFKAFGEGLDPWQTLYIEAFKKEVDAELDIGIELELSGDSAHELAASAKGDVLMVFKNGLLRRDLMDLVFADIVGWVWGKARREKYYEFSCGVAEYSIDQGVVTTRAFLLDAESIIISGDGTIDLGKEQVDYVLLPKKKSRVIGQADPVKLTGALNDPSVKVIPWKSAVSTYGTYSTLLFAPYVFVGVAAADFLAGVFKRGVQDSPCLEYEKHRAAQKGTVP